MTVKNLEDLINHAFDRYKGRERLFWPAYDMGITERLNHTFLYLLTKCFTDFKANMINNVSIADFYKNLDEGTGIVIEGTEVPERWPSILVIGTSGTSKSTTIGEAVSAADEDYQFLKRFIGTTNLRVQGRNTLEMDRIGDMVWRFLSGPLIGAFGAIDTAVMSVNMAANRKEKVSSDFNKWYKDISVSYDVANIAVLASLDSPLLQKQNLKRVTVRG